MADVTKMFCWSEGCNNFNLDCIIYNFLLYFMENNVVFLYLGVNDFIPDHQPSPMTDSGLSSSSTSSSISLGNTSAAISHMHSTLLSEVDISGEQDEKMKPLMEFITSR